MDIYKYAAQQKLRFPTARGLITVEDLFSLPLSHRSGVDLDTVAKSIHAELKQASEESFVNPPSNPKRKPLEVALEVVKDVIATQQAAAAAALGRAQKAAQKQKILEVIESKKDQKLSEASIEDLTKQLAELGD